MGDGTKLLKVIDQMGKNQMNDTSDFVMGTVISVTPLEIKVGDKTVLSADFLTLSPLCIEKKIDLNHIHTYSGTTGDAGPGPHSHSYSGNVVSNGPGEAGIFTLWRGLQANDSVLMLKSKGGQKYYVLQRQEGI